MRKRMGWIRVGAALGSALLVAGMFPPFNAAVLAWVALVPLLAALWSLEGKRAAWKGFGLGWLAGGVSSAVQFSWFGEVSWLAAILVPLYLGCYWGLFGAFAASLGNPWHKHRAGEPVGPHHTRRKRLLAAALPTEPGSARLSLRTAFCHGSLWAGLEWLRSWMLTGFSWNGLGVAFHETPLMAQAADLLGVTGLSLLLVFFQAVMVQTGKRLLQGSPAGKRLPRRDLAVAILLVILLLGYGMARISSEGRRESVRLRALLVQLNIPQDATQMLWEPLAIHRAYEEETLGALEAIAKSAATRPSPDRGEAAEVLRPARWPDWVLWPETALCGRILRTPDGGWGTWQQNLDTIAQVRTAGPFSLIYGVNELEGEPKGDQVIAKPGGHMYNSLAVMSPTDELQTFRKHQLVIFGETIPFVDSLPWLKRIYENQSGTEYNGSFTPGDSFEPLPVMAHGTSIGVIPSVCFEDTVPRLTRQFVRPGPQVIVNVTNDGWFKESVAAAQHFADARFRAIELRRPMLRCANTGVSAAINTVGSTAHPDTGAPQVLTDATGSHFTRGSLLVELNVPLEPAVTLYALIGDGGILLLTVLSLAISLLTRPVAPRPVPNPQPAHHPHQQHHTH